jgi:hypothetical protein
MMENGHVPWRAIFEGREGNEVGVIVILPLSCIWNTLVTDKRIQADLVISSMQNMTRHSHIPLFNIAQIGA